MLHSVVLGQTHKAEALAFLEFFHAYLDNAAGVCGVDPLDFRSMRVPGDVWDLFRALKGGVWMPPEPG